MLVNLDAFVQLCVSTLRTFKDPQTAFTEGVRNRIKRFTRGSVVARTFFFTREGSGFVQKACRNLLKRRGEESLMRSPITATDCHAWAEVGAHWKLPEIMKKDMINEWKRERKQGGSPPKHPWFFIIFLSLSFLLPLFPPFILSHFRRFHIRDQFFCLFFYTFLSLFINLFICYMFYL